MMKKLLFCLSLLLFLMTTAEARNPIAPTSAANLKQHMPLLFTENKGQVTDKAGNARPDILFTAHSGAAQVFFTAIGIQYQFTRTIYPEGYHDIKLDAAKRAALAKQIEVQTHLFSLTLKNANPQPVVRREKKNAFTENFYTANALHDGIIKVATYEKMVYENVYPNIDWVIYSDEKKLKYDFVIHPGGDPSLIKLNIQDAEQVSITNDGELLMKTSLGEVKEKAPLSFADGKIVPSRFKKNSDGTIGFEVTTIPGTTLVIDPSVTWATYYGGTGQEVAEGLSLDASGNIYIAGITTSTTGIAMAGGYQTSMVATQDNFLVKFNASGTPLWATYYGSSFSPSPGGNAEQGGACATDNSGNVYLLATASVAPLSVDLSTPGAYQTSPAGGTDVYLVKFDASGIRQWATYYGGSGNEYAWGCTSNSSGDVYITGVTASTSGIATAGAYQTTYGGGNTDLFLAKFNTSGAIQWATYIGGPSFDGDGGYIAYSFHNCALDNSGNVFVAGKTQSASDIASAGAQQTVLNGGWDAFLFKFSATGTRLWSTYFGGNDQDGVVGVSVAVDATGNAYLTGDTYSTTGVATAGASQTTYSGNGDNFLVKYNSAGTLQWATYSGNTGYEFPGCVIVNTAGSVYLAATTYSFNTLTGGFQSANLGGSDGYITKYTSAGTVQWSSYFGGPGTDNVTACAATGQDLILLGKTVSTTNIATPGAFKTTLTGTSEDAFLVRINDVPVCIPDSVVVTDTVCSNQLPYTWQGNTIPAGGINVATDTLINAIGCDSVLHLTLIVNPVATSTVYDTTCRNEFPYASGPFSISTAPAGNTATATYTTTAANGCDSIVTLNLFVKDTSAVTATMTYCRNELPAVWNGVTIPITAVSNPAYTTYTTNNIGGCDSVVTLNLVVYDTFAVTVYDTTCRNDFPYTSGPFSIPTAPAGNTTTVIYNGLSVHNCDSVVTLHLYIKDTSAYTVYDTICSGQLPYTWNGISVTAGGPAAAVFVTPNAVNCDSVVTLNLTVNNPSTYTEYMTKCSNDLPFVWNGITVTAGGSNAASYTTQNSVGCDSIVTLDLTVNNISTTTETITICAYELPYVWHGITVTSGGTAVATDTLVNGTGCDSIISLDLIVNPTITPTISITATPGTTVNAGTPVTFSATVTNGGTAPVLQWKKNGANVGTNSTTYIDANIDSADVITCTLVSNAPCADPDTLISNDIVMIVITPPPPCLVPLTLISTDIQLTSAVFKWEKVSGATGYEFVLDLLPSNPSSGMFTADTAYHASALLPGVYYFHIRTKCASGSYSPWITIVITILDSSTGIPGIGGSDKKLMLYPNPNNGVFYIEGEVAEQKAAVDIVDKTGRVIYRKDVVTPGGKLLHQVRLSEQLSQGIYLLRVVSGNQVMVLRFVSN